MISQYLTNSGSENGGGVYQRRGINVLQRWQNYNRLWCRMWRLKTPAPSDLFLKLYVVQQVYRLLQRLRLQQESLFQEFAQVIKKDHVYYGVDVPEDVDKMEQYILHTIKKIMG